MSSEIQNETEIIRHLDVGATCCDAAWEAAYERFETREEEVQKFLRRLRRFGVDRLSENSKLVELFCGRGGGLVALERLGLTHIEGVDLSEELLRQYRGPAKLHLADCRDLPFADGSFDAAIVQGGLHHLPTLPGDLDAVLSEVARILKPNGMIYVVEPWQTPFLRFVHFVVSKKWVRRVYAKGDALAEMTEHEQETYDQWLSQPAEIREIFQRHFAAVYERTAWGKLMFAGHPLPVDG